MAQLLVLYNSPADPAAFDRYYRETHIPLAKKMPGLRSYSVSRGPVQAPMGTAPHLVAVLDFDSMAGLSAALNSPEGQAAAADVPNFASGGATSDTTVAILTDVPNSGPANAPVPFAEALSTQEITAGLTHGGASRLLVENIISPNVGPVEATLDEMERHWQQAKGSDPRSEEKPR